VVIDLWLIKADDDRVRIPKTIFETLLSENDTRIAVLEHEAHTLRREPWIERKIGSPRLENREHRRHHVDRSLHEDGDYSLRTDSQPAQTAGEPMNLLAKARIRQNPIATDNRDFLRGAERLLVEEIVDKLPAVELDLSSVPMIEPAVV
jgi:hypothetical protein